MNRRILLPLLVIALVLSSCAAKNTSSNNRQTLDYAVPAAAPAYEMPAADVYSAASAEEAAYGSAQEAEPAQAERLVIRTANLSVAVADPANAMERISQMADEMGGYVVSSNLYKTTALSGIEVPEANISIRVRAERLDDALARVKAMTENPANDVLSENTIGQDVTDRYTDLQSRLKNMEATEEGLQELMDRAVKAEDILAIYNQLTTIREQIEVTKGQIKYYEESAALSLVNVTLRSKAAIEPLTVAGWQPVGVARDALQATVEAGKFLVNAAIWLVLFGLPIGLLAYAVIRLVIWLIRRNRKPKAIVPPVDPTAAI